MCMSRNHTKWVVLTCGPFTEKGKQAKKGSPVQSKLTYMHTSYLLVKQILYSVITILE